ncbi:unnamed protein product [Prunus brigantina]
MRARTLQVWKEWSTSCPTSRCCSSQLGLSRFATTFDPEWKVWPTYLQTQFIKSTMFSYAWGLFPCVLAIATTHLSISSHTWVAHQYTKPVIGPNHGVSGRVGPDHDVSGRAGLGPSRHIFFHSDPCGLVGPFELSLGAHDYLVLQVLEDDLVGHANLVQKNCLTSISKRSSSI